VNAPRRLGRDRASAELAGVEKTLATLTDNDFLTRMSLEARRDEIAETLAVFEHAGPETVATAALFFGGRPVAGSKGVESEFAGAVVGRFQDLVAKVLAQDSGGLGERGVVPNKSAATLHITDVVRGSFGFVLEEVEPQGYIIDTALKAAVDNASQILSAFGDPDESHFQEAMERVDERVLTTARDFFQFMRQSGATFRLVAGDADSEFPAGSIDRAAERATTTKVEDAPESLDGQLAGVLPDGHLFEFRSVRRGTINGRVDRGIAASELDGWNARLRNVDATATIRVRRVSRGGSVVRESFTLLGVEPRGGTVSAG
jgi:hypothetical protein